MSILKKNALILVSIMLVFSCKPPAQEYFGTAALNCNIFSRFGSYEIKEFLASPPETYDASAEKMVPASYQDYFKSRCVNDAVERYEKVKALPETEDTKKMIEASKSLFQFCVSKYQNDYLQIAKMKDEKKPQAEIDAVLAKFDADNLPEFARKYEGAWAEGMAYAKANGIEVQTVNTSPQFK